MNRKVLLAVLPLAVVLLATPCVGMVSAGKGEEKLDFLLHMEGTTRGPPENVWTADSTNHIQGLPWIVVEDFYIEIGEEGNVETIPKECLSYFGYLDIMVNQKQGFYVGTVKEIITVYTDSTKTTERGTIEILNTAKTNSAVLNTLFNGHGTDEFEGVKVNGRTVASTMTNPNPPPANLLVLDRVGTVMGWP